MEEVRVTAILQHPGPPVLRSGKQMINPGSVCNVRHPLRRQHADISDPFRVWDLADPLEVLYEIEALGQRADFALAARRSNVAERLTPTQEGWFVAVRKKARSVRVGPFDRDALAALAPELPRTLKSPKDFASLPSKLAAVGVRLVHLEAFPSSKIDGCAFMLDGVPVIGLSGRGHCLDKVLFTLLHEVAHLVLDHVGETPIVEDADEVAAPEDDTESAANEMAQVWALPGGLPVEPFRVSEAWVTTMAERADVNPIVVIGRLQYSGLLSWRTSLVKNAPTVAAQLAEWK